MSERTQNTNGHGVKPLTRSRLFISVAGAVPTGSLCPPRFLFAQRDWGRARCCQLLQGVGELPVEGSKSNTTTHAGAGCRRKMNSKKSQPKTKLKSSSFLSVQKLSICSVVAMCFLKLQQRGGCSLAHTTAFCQAGWNRSSTKASNCQRGILSLFLVLVNGTQHWSATAEIKMSDGSRGVEGLQAFTSRPFSWVFP